RAALQIITIADRYFEVYRRTPDFIQPHIFPGGMLPSPAALDREYAKAGLEKVTETHFGESYAKTLAAWHGRFQTAWDDLRTMGFDDRFKRTWEYYLAACEAGFRAKCTDVTQVGLRRA
ncbi:MAG: class I SAM-dependent methyltransferase, partial [Geminicoccaceae bacterium]